MVFSGPSPVRPLDPISVTVVLSNTGASWITVLPLAFAYDPLYLRYGANGHYSLPVPDAGSVGRLDWTDLTAASLAQDGFGADLPSGASFGVVIWLTALQNTSSLPSASTVISVTAGPATADPDGVDGPLPPLALAPSSQTGGDVTVRKPTGVGVMGFRGSVAGAGGVSLTWGTAAETDIGGSTCRGWTWGPGGA